jgi:hypothetical protein
MRLATRSTVTAAALTAVAIASPVASARPAPSGPGTALAVTAIGAPAASARPPGPLPQSPVQQAHAVPVAPSDSRWVPPSQLAAIERARAQALANHVPPSGRYTGADTNAQATVSHSNPATTSGSGFDGSDAAIGAGIAAAIVLLITAGTLAVRQRRQPRHP